MHDPAAPSDPRRAQLSQAFQALRQGLVEEAARLRDALLAAYPEDAEVRYLATEVCIAENQLEAALAHSERACELAPGQWPLLLKQARVLLGLRRRRDFRRVAGLAADAAGSDPQALWEVGRAHIGNDDPAAAQPLFERALACGGDAPGLHLNLANARFFGGDFDGAEASAEAALARAPRFGEAVYLRSTLRRATPERNHLADLQARLAQIEEPHARAATLYALAKEREDLGRHGEAFEALAEGAALKARALGYDVQPELDTLQALSECFSAEALATLADGDQGEGAIFIVGMPRTGTTLAERMLDRHPRVRSAGELMDFKQLLSDGAAEAHGRHPQLSRVQAALHIDFAALGREYLRGAREAADGAEVFIDKMPVNFMYCGLIAKALPRAKIVHLVRDPMDSCYAVFKTLFQQAYFFSYEQQALADYYTAYRRLMRHWQSVLPGRILDLRYEDLVSDTSNQARRLLDFCGLDWDEAVLAPDANARPSTTASAAQVREPVHARSVGRWRSVAEGLEPLRQRLQAHGLVDAEGRAAEA
jgi:Flp pilus assembly protein TadD